ncbi:hypothetical protein HZA97_08745 [Candidatus Woesearchaeota archaeon]|nr:hypothetical protein [Candidatus Woesearchaeota archaeon]
MNFSKKELQDLGKAWLLISLAFAIVFRKVGISFYEVFLLSALTVGLGFLLHELAHKFVAQKYGYWAEFRSDDKMLLLAFLMSFFGFVFAAPGGVLMPRMGLKKEGIVALAGPATNVLLSLIFFGLNYWQPNYIFSFGLYINSFLAIFNLIPFPSFDGQKIFQWNKIVWGVSVVIAGLVLYVPLA